MKNLKTILFVLTVSVFAFTFTSCKSDDEPETQVSVKLTDGPFPFNFATEANVTVQKIELQNESGEYVTVFEGESGYNMVALTNGISADVTSTSLAAGTYTQAKITIKGESVGFNNNFNIDVSGDVSTTTEVIYPPLVIEEGSNSNLLLDLDLSNSFSFSEVLGGITDWITNVSGITTCSFTPQLRVVDLDQTGEISGTVTANGEAVANAEVTINANGTEINTHTEADGTYRFIGIVAGNYTVTVDTSDDFSGSNTTEVSGTDSAKCDVTIE